MRAQAVRRLAANFVLTTVHRISLECSSTELPTRLARSEPQPAQPTLTPPQPPSPSPPRNTPAPPPSPPTAPPRPPSPPAGPPAPPAPPSVSNPHSATHHPRLSALPAAPAHPSLLPFPFFAAPVPARRRPLAPASPPPAPSPASPPAPSPRPPSPTAPALPAPLPSLPAPRPRRLRHRRRPLRRRRRRHHRRLRLRRPVPRRPRLHRRPLLPQPRRLRARRRRRADPRAHLGQVPRAGGGHLPEVQGQRGRARGGEGGGGRGAGRGCAGGRGAGRGGGRGARGVVRPGAVRQQAREAFGVSPHTCRLASGRDAGGCVPPLTLGNSPSSIPPLCRSSDDEPNLDDDSPPLVPPRPNPPAHDGSQASASGSGFAAPFGGKPGASRPASGRPGGKPDEVELRFDDDKDLEFDIIDELSPPAKGGGGFSGGGGGGGERGGGQGSRGGPLPKRP